MIRRNLAQHLLSSLQRTPIVSLLGPRQGGKSTLARMLQAGGFSAGYLTLDDAVTLAGAESDPEGFVSRLPERVIVDEAQRAPELLRAIQRCVEENQKPRHFLLTASAQTAAMAQLALALGNRMETLTLWPLSQGEIGGGHEGFVDACFAPEFKPGSFSGANWESLTERIVAGGYPEALARPQPGRRQAWFGACITAILERDVRDLANVSALRELPRLLQLAASRATSLLNIADLARDSGLPQTTLHRYWALFEATFLLQLLPPWHAPLGFRLVKGPKVLITDTGLLCYLLGLDAARLQADDLMAGAALENFVATELMKQAGWSAARPRLFHDRTHTQQSVDLLMEDAHGRLVGIQVKKTAIPAEADFEGLRHLSQHTG
jgi:predicted AAA+ superfamily ATPase